MRVNLDKNFTKYVSSKRKALEIVKKLAQKYGETVDSYTSYKLDRRTVEVSGETKTFVWYYTIDEKELVVNYIDGRKEPTAEEEKPKKLYYIIWIEGISPKNGEKIKRFKEDGSIEYTLKMRDAMRVLPEDLPTVKQKLRDLKIASWVVDTPETYVKTNYANKNNIFRA